MTISGTYLKRGKKLVQNFYCKHDSTWTSTCYEYFTPCQIYKIITVNINVCFLEIVKGRDTRGSDTTNKQKRGTSQDHLVSIFSRINMIAAPNKRFHADKHVSQAQINFQKIAEAYQWQLMIYQQKRRTSQLDGETKTCLSHPGLIQLPSIQCSYWFQLASPPCP